MYVPFYFVAAALAPFGFKQTYGLHCRKANLQLALRAAEHAHTAARIRSAATKSHQKECEHSEVGTCETVAKKL